MCHAARLGDHIALLRPYGGTRNTLTLIAGEKAGIIKPGLPVVCSPQQEEALAVLERVWPNETLR